MPDTDPGFKNIQYRFTAHLRDPENNPAPGEIEDRRMEIYRGLIYRNIQNFLSNAFPVTRMLYSDDHWHKLVRHFFSAHQCHSPYFKDISKEFIDYLTNEHQAQPEDPPFLYELAHYEWIEIVLTLMDGEIDWSRINKKGNLLKDIPILTPFMQLQSYEYPVHKITPDFQPETPGQSPTFILIYRDLKDKVGFLELNPITARLVELISENQSRTSEDILTSIAEQIPGLTKESVLHGGHIALNELFGKDIFLGTRKA